MHKSKNLLRVSRYFGGLLHITNENLQAIEKWKAGTSQRLPTIQTRLATRNLITTLQ